MKIEVYYRDTGRLTGRRTIGVSCDSSRVYTVFIVYRKQPLASCNEVQFLLRVIHDDSSNKTDYRDSLSGWMIHLLARIYTQTDYQTSYRSLPKLVLDG